MPIALNGLNELEVRTNLDVVTLPPLRAHNRPPALLCEVLFRNYGDTIRIQKAHVAILNLEKIILAVLETGSRKGFYSTTSRDLAGASGLSMGAIYSYVESKETLLRMILSVSHRSRSPNAHAHPPDGCRPASASGQCWRHG